MAKKKKPATTEVEEYRIYKITHSTFIFKSGSKPRFLEGKPSPPPTPPGHG